jgi:hypothetical protein
MTVHARQIIQKTIKLNLKRQSTKPPRSVTQGIGFLESYKPVRLYKPGGSLRLLDY